MQRKIDWILDSWLNDRKSAVLLYGARQVGKTYSIRKCFERNNRHFVEINFATDNASLDLFSKLSSVEDFYIKLSLVASSPLNEKESCVFLDEIQEVYRYREDLMKTNPELYHKTIDPITLIKKLVDEGRYRYALSESLLVLNLSYIQSNPVGYMDTYTMYPLDFEEFLTCKEVGPEVISYLKNQFETVSEVEETIHEKIMTLFQQYILVGGMPEAVSLFLESLDLEKVRISQKQLLDGYQKDIQKYAPLEQRILISETYKSIPGELN